MNWSDSVMSDAAPEPRNRDVRTPTPEEPLHAHVARRAARHQRAQREGQRSAWFSLGMMGLVGWSVAVPTLLGIALGWWIDTTWPSRVSWTLMLLFAGVAIGCFNAWYWVRQESERR
jgi:ATP synthase protein I